MYERICQTVRYQGLWHTQDRTTQAKPFSIDVEICGNAYVDEWVAEESFVTWLSHALHKKYILVSNRMFDIESAVTVGRTTTKVNEPPLFLDLDGWGEISGRFDDTWERYGFLAAVGGFFLDALVTD